MNALWRARLERARRFWPLAVFLLTLLLHRHYLAPGGPWTRGLEPARMGFDESTVLYDSARIADGQVMYRDFFEFQGPVFYYTYATLFEVTGRSWEAARWLQILTQAAAATLMAMVVARLTRSPAAGLGAALVQSCMLVPMFPMAYPHWMTEAFILGALVLVADEDPSPRRLVAGGALAALALWCIQSLGLPALVAMVAGVAFPGLARRDWKQAALRPAWLLAGAGAVTALVFVYFAAHGALGAMLHDMFGWTLRNYPEGNKDAVKYARYVDDFVRGFEKAKISGFDKFLGILGLRVTQFLPFAAFAAAAVLAPLAAWRLWKRDPRHAELVGGGAAVAALSPLWLSRVRVDITHVAFVAGIGLVAAAAALAWATRWRAGRAAVTALFLVVGLLLWENFRDKAARTAGKYPKDMTFEKMVLNMPRARRIAATPKGATVVIGEPGAGLYYFFLRDNATAFTYVAEYQAYFSDAQWRRFADEIMARRPAYVVLTPLQLGQVKKLRPDFTTAYRAEGGAWVPVSP